MIHIKYHAPGTPPATLISHAESNGKPSVITLIQYDNETIFEGQFDNFDDLMRRFDPSLVNWINVDGLSDVELLRKLGDNSISIPWLWKTCLTRRNGPRSRIIRSLLHHQ